MNFKHFVITCFLLIPISNLSAGWEKASAPRRLVGGGDQQYLRPVWSPNGEQVAFTTPGYQGIQVVNLATGEVTQISDERAAGFGFRWSRDGSAIVARTARYEKRRRLNDVKVFDLTTGKSWSVSGEQRRFKGVPRWTKNDKAIFILGKRTVQVFDSGLTSSTLETTASDAKLYFLSRGKIAVADNSGSQLQRLEPVPGGRYINLVISPDESKLAFELVGGNLHVVNVDGSELVDLGAGFRPGWSPDGGSIIYQVSEDDGHAITGSDIFVINADGSEKSNLTNTSDIPEMNPCWSPDGSKIAFDVDGEGVIYVMEIKRN